MIIRIFICVLDFQKIFPKAKDIISQAELVKDDIILFNKKIIQLNAELESITERCPLEISVMCSMISSNKLQAENFSFLVREQRALSFLGCLIHYSTTIYRLQDDLINVIRGVLEVENDGLLSLPLTSAESANIPKALYEQTEKERWRK